MKNKYGNWACVLGSAEGLGAAFSRQLAKKGYRLILIDKNPETLNKTTLSIRNEFNTEIIEVIADLNVKQSLDNIISVLAEKQCRFMIYNAAYGPVKPFLGNTESELNTYINVNVSSTLHLVYQFIKLNQKKITGIMLLSSLAGFRGTRFVVPYAATKAFLWNFGEGLHYEFKDKNLDVSICCPGTTDTPGFQSTKPKLMPFAPKPMDPDVVAKEALKYFGKRLFIIPGTGNKLTHLILNKILPRRWASSIHNNAMKKMYDL